MSELHRDLVVSVAMGTEQSSMQWHQILQGSEHLDEIFCDLGANCDFNVQNPAQKLLHSALPLKESCQVPTHSESIHHI